MMPCCYFCYEKYINEDGKIDEIALFKIVKKRIKERHQTVEEAKSLFEYLIKYPCTCECHKKGTKVLH